MSQEKPKIVFMGTPDFAVASLDALVSAGHRVVGVVTMPDKPIGRHQTQLSISPVKRYALDHGLPVLQPERLKDPEFLDALRAWEPDLGVVVAFRMLPEVVWGMPPMGTFNLHAALLPQYRGAAPINWAIINGDSETGVTTFLLDHDIDTGLVLRREVVPIGPDDNAGDVHDRLMELGARLVVETTDALASGDVQPIPQSEMTVDDPLRPAPKIFKDTCRIDWAQPAQRVHDFIRGLSPYPAAWTTLVLPSAAQPLTLKVYGARISGGMADASRLCTAAPGTLVTDGKTYLRAVTADGMLDLLEIQLSGKKRMPVADFLRGFRPEEGMRLE